MKNDLSISKYKLWKYVNKKVNRIVNRFHVLSVISILFEEMITDLKNNKKVKIFNFGEFELKKTPTRNFFNVFTRQMYTSGGFRLLKFKLNSKVRKKILSHLDVEKTFKDDDEKKT